MLNCWLERWFTPNCSDYIFRRVLSPLLNSSSGLLGSDFCLCRNSFWMRDQLYNTASLLQIICLKRCQHWDVFNNRTLCLPVCLSCLVMTSGITSGHDFRCHFRSWLPVPLLVMTSCVTSGHDFRYHFGHDFRYHLWLWLQVPLTVMTRLWLVTSGTTSGTISGHDFWQYHVAS